MMKSLVTGGMGFIGSHLVKELRKLGHTVICVDNVNLPDDFHYDDSVNRVKGDIRDYALMKTLMEGVDYVFHFAAEMNRGDVIEFLCKEQFVEDEKRFKEKKNKNINKNI